MSNVIKSYTVRYEDDKKTIDANSWEIKKVFYKGSDGTSRNDAHNDDEFIGGLQAVVVDPMITNIQDSEDAADNNKAEDIAVGIIDNARQQANRILEAAYSEAEKNKSDAYAEAKNKGYEEGLKQGKLDIQKQINELKNKARQQDEEFEAYLADLEPKMVEIMSSLIEKITGVIVEDKQEVILYLVEKAFRNTDKADSFIIRVSKDDYEFLSSKREYIISSIGREVHLDIIEDMEFHKNQCQIETELRVIDCSLDVQLRNLISDLRLMCSL